MLSPGSCPELKVSLAYYNQQLYPQLCVAKEPRIVNLLFFRLPLPYHLSAEAQ